MKANMIKGWMAIHGLTRAEVARRAGVAYSTVFRFVEGEKTSLRLYTWFVGEGCPKGYFGRKYKGREQEEREAA